MLVVGEKQVRFGLYRIKGSLRKGSRTAILVDAVVEALKKRNVEVDILDLRELKMEFADGRTTNEYGKDMQDAISRIKACDAAVIGMPVYQYSVAGPLKNFLDITTEAFNYKPFAIALNSGGIRSYLAAAELMKLMSFEAFAVPISPIVHTWEKDYTDGKLTNERIPKKIEEMLDALLKWVR